MEPGEIYYREFPELLELLKNPLTTDSRHADTLRREMALAESQGILLAQYVRNLEQAVEDAYREELETLHANPPANFKLTVDNQKVLLDERTSEIRAKLKYVKELQELVKRRCLLGQSFLNSMNVERSTSNFNS